MGKRVLDVACGSKMFWFDIPLPSPFRKQERKTKQDTLALLYETAGQEGVT